MDSLKGSNNHSRNRSLFIGCSTFLLLCLCLHLFNVAFISPAAQRSSRLSKPILNRQHSTWLTSPLQHHDPSTCKPEHNPLPTLHPLPTGDLHSPSLVRYIERHRKYKPCFDATTHPPCETIPPALVWSCPPTPCCGLGDRLNFIILSFIIAIASERLLFIDWPKHSNLSHSFGLELGLAPAWIDWRLPTNLSIDGSSSHFLIWEDVDQQVQFVPINRSPSTTAKNISFNFAKDDFASILNGHNIQLFRLYARIPNRHFTRVLTNPFVAKSYPDLQLYSKHGSEAYTRFTRTLFQTLFRPSEAVEHRIRHLGLDEMGRKPYVSIHIRSGLDIEPHDPRFVWAWVTTPKQLATVMFNCLVSLKNDSHNLFVASDSTDIKEEVKRLALQRQFQVASLGSKVVHLANRQENQHTCDQVLDVYVDLVVLSRAQAFLTTGSFFAEAAFLLGSTVKKWVVLPRNDTLKCENIIGFDAGK